MSSCTLASRSSRDADTGRQGVGRRQRARASEAVGEGLRILGRTFEEHWPEQWLQLMEQNPLLSPASRLRTAAASAETPMRRLYE